MPFATAADGTRLRYEVFGAPAGEPVLLIQGLGADVRGWLLQRRALGRLHRVIVFDNRGAGRSGKPPAPYDIEVMAADAVAVLDDAGIATAHVMGASMGGILAPVGDSEELVERIPGAGLVVLPGAAHGLMLEQAGPFNRAVLGFLDRVTAPAVDEAA